VAPIVPEMFDGFYLGSSIGSQNIFGGAFINNLDFLTQKSGFVLELVSGYRRQFLKNRLLVGFEANILMNQNRDI